MYYPYLRGKQFELLAIKELAPTLAPNRNVVPVIEPVREPNGSGLDRCIGALEETGIRFALVVNPNVGALASTSIAPPLVEFLQSRHGSDRWGLALLIDAKTDVDQLVDDYERNLGRRHALMLVNNGLPRNSPDQVAALARRLSEHDLTEALIADDLRGRHYAKSFPEISRVTMHDGFPAAPRNAAYLQRDPSLFSDDITYYEEEGWAGFGDYLTIGKEFSEGGFTPRAVAIHWTYKPASGDGIMIRHFVSDTVDGTGGVGEKFLEAAQKAVTFFNQERIETAAARALRDYVDRQYYPGLGIIKKLSIQNHLELVSKLLVQS